jgi:hypothetical protein
LVKYYDNWGKKVLEAKTVAMTYHRVHCQLENKNFGSAEECRAADKDCCFECENMDCGGDIPSGSTCANNQPSAVMKKFGITECSTSDSIEMDPMTEWYVCGRAWSL